MRTDAEVQWVPVREVGDVRMGKQLSPASRDAAGQFPYLRVANVLQGRIDYTDVKKMGFSAAERETYGLKPGDILLNEGQSLELVGRSAIYGGTEGEFCFQNTLIRFRPGDLVLSAYAQVIFERWLANGVFAAIAKQTTSIAHLGGERFASLSFPLLPLPKQRRIIEMVRALSAQECAVEASIVKLGMLKAGVMSELADMDRGIFGDVLNHGPQNGIYKPASSYGPEGTPIVRIDSFKGGPSDLTRGLLRVSLGKGEIDHYGLAVGDIIINRVNTPELVGKSTAVGKLVEPTVFESNMMRCKVWADLAVPAFVETWLGGPPAKEHFRVHAKSAISQASINGSDVRNCPFPRLDVPGQLEFLERVAAVSDQQKLDEAELVKLGKIKQGVVDDLLGLCVRA
ncbi:restriction endonuclease subunit S [Kitasatospora sp. NPDC058032]|uniref:restriction endonuclease subunit S n=1 Tax=Kitasatospora sp. NPDC058032 TaxID=3346307 RepID=UPI0036DEFC72